MDYRTKEELLTNGYLIENNEIEMARINVIGHFGNYVQLELIASDVAAYIGPLKPEIIKTLVELFEKTEEDGYDFTRRFNHIPCRLVLEKHENFGARCVGFGHFMKDKFVLNSDL